MSVASIFAVASSIFIVAIFYIIGANVEYFMHQLESQMGMAVRIDEELSDTDRQRLGQRLREIRHVAKVTFVTKEEALEKMRDVMGDDAIRGLELDNPLRDTFMVELTDLAFYDEVEHAILNLRQYGAAQVDSDAEFAMTLSAISTVVYMVTVSLILMLAFISIIIITNTIRITVNARKTEINIMKYVGATDWFIRWPFVLEGMIIGFMGGAVPAFICYFGYARIISAIHELPMLAWISFMPEEHIMRYVFPLSFALGVLIGLIGSVTSVKKHLKV